MELGTPCVNCIIATPKTTIGNINGGVTIMHNKDTTFLTESICSVK